VTRPGWPGNTPAGHPYTLTPTDTQHLEETV
jgi:hypothetical protein